MYDIFLGIVYMSYYDRNQVEALTLINEYSRAKMSFLYSLKICRDKSGTCYLRRITFGEFGTNYFISLDLVISYAMNKTYHHFSSCRISKISIN